MEIERKITELLEAKFNEPLFEDCFLIELYLSGKNNLEVFLDSDQGITIEKCKIISRYLEQYLDEQLWLGEKYTLEVSSAGLERPLKLKRQYKKNIGRQLEVYEVDHPEVQTGKLIDVTDESITIEYTVIVKEGKKKKETIVQTAIPFEKIKKALVKISF